MAKPKLYPYVVYYVDQTFQTIDMTKADFDSICLALAAGTDFVKISIGIQGLRDVRSIYERIDPKEVEEETKEQPAIPEINYAGFPNMSVQEEAWLQSHLANEEAQLKRKKAKAEVDYQ